MKRVKQIAEMKRVMNMTRKYVIAGMIVLLLMTSVGYSAPAKLAQTGFQFLSVGSDARCSALVNAVTTLSAGAGCMFYNPAGMARMDANIDVMISQNNWIDNIKYNSFAVALSPQHGRFGVFGISAMSVDYGDVQGTMVWGNERGFIETEILHPSAFSVGMAYAKSLSNKFAIGTNIKYTGQQLGQNVVAAGDLGDSLKTMKNVTFATAFDFGTIYKTGFKSLAFGMSINNFAREIKFVRENFELPLTFKIGVSMDIFDLLRKYVDEKQSLYVSVDALHPRDYPEQLNVGLEYKLINTFFLRGGYMLVADEQDFSLGFGLQKFGATIDYAYLPFGVFDNVQMFTLRFSL
ncbi:MAG: PorV/PorQ family protein [Candidatus Marinimicrobia bacterium]|nr:PorV/PorQ family protein [Candidatus Neomarinimicrobiota bacterium]